MGPPDPGETPIPDASLAYLILGCFRAATSFGSFPIMVDHVEDNLDEQGTIQSFTIVTASGLKFTTHVDFEERCSWCAGDLSEGEHGENICGGWL